MNITEIALHTAPTMIVGALLGFSAAMGIHYLPVWQGALGAVILAGCAVYCSWLWTPREKSQHGGKLGGQQSQLEAMLPLVAGPLGFIVSLVAFWTWPL